MERVLAAWKRSTVLAKDIAGKMDVFKCPSLAVLTKKPE